MIDIDSIINDPELILAKLATRGYKLDVDLIAKLHSERKLLIQNKETIAANKNKLNDKFRNAKTDSEKDLIKIESQDLERSILENKNLLEKKEQILEDIILDIPNIPSSGIPVGEDESFNKILKSFGTLKKSDSEHSSLLSKKGLLNFELGGSIAKTRFVVMKGQIAKLHRALITYMLNTHTEINNYIEYNVPYIANKSSLIGTGQLPKFEEDLFKIQDTELYLIPTAEVPLTNIYRDKILNESDLPLKLVAHTPCFRSEAGSYGKDTKGIIRQHQFEKIELVQIVKPQMADETLELITSHAENIMEALEIPYQRVLLSTGDLGFSSSRTNDIEAWFPSQNAYREISSCSSFTDFQSRRLNIKYREMDSKKKNYVYTLNGSGLAVGRTMAALIENHINGNIISIPTVLQNLTGFKTIEL
ncbi:MAG: serine--tRNA ligase [Gammaproteobacteria bacterium]|nr:serine--tRNA ligase [Gammaproteobacteria bacterium]MBT6734683.1 serine--tRNA ligase [Gammaproteobacteria bacterium]|tara:strand:- start:27 stop:1283 length:1257 start_codon:yes stop_codon:yes gene_type:complete